MIRLLACGADHVVVKDAGVRQLWGRTGLERDQLSKAQQRAEITARGLTQVADQNLTAVDMAALWRLADRLLDLSNGAFTVVACTPDAQFALVEHGGTIYLADRTSGSDQPLTRDEAVAEIKARAMRAVDLDARRDMVTLWAALDRALWAALERTQRPTGSADEERLRTQLAGVPSGVLDAMLARVEELRDIDPVACAQACTRLVLAPLNSDQRVRLAALRFTRPA